jgi:hypothetical protein
LAFGSQILKCPDGIRPESVVGNRQ